MKASIHVIRSGIKTLLETKASRRLHLRQLPFAAFVGISVIFVSGSALAAHAIVAHNDARAAQKASALAKSEHANFQSEATKQTQVAQKSDDAKHSQPATPSATRSSASTTTSQPVIKYKTDPDPRSLAYSTTPPAPNPKSFNIAITHNGQVSPGTEISYNATKDAKTYYGGDYKFSTSTLVIHKTYALVSDVFTVSTPDGANAEEPALPWYTDNSNYWPQTSAPDGPSTSWKMSIGISSATPTGTYQVHLTSFRTNEGADAWEYDGFITLEVES